MRKTARVKNGKHEGRRGAGGPCGQRSLDRSLRSLAGGEGESGRNPHLGLLPGDAGTPYGVKHTRKEGHPSIQPIQRRMAVSQRMVLDFQAAGKDDRQCHEGRNAARSRGESRGLGRDLGGRNQAHENCQEKRWMPVSKMHGRNRSLLHNAINEVDVATNGRRRSASNRNSASNCVTKHLWMLQRHMHFQRAPSAVLHGAL